MQHVLLRLALSGETTRLTKLVKKLPPFHGVRGELAAMKAEYRHDKIRSGGRHFNLSKSSGYFTFHQV